MSLEFMAKGNSIVDSPNALIHVSGLGILCFNDFDKRMEVGFLNIKKHNPFISVFERKDGTGPRIPLVQNRSIEGKVVEFSTESSGIGKVYKGDDEEKLFDKIIHFDEIYDDADLAIKDDPTNFISRVYLKGFTVFSDEKKKPNVVAYNINDENDVVFEKNKAGGFNCIPNRDDSFKEIIVDNEKIKNDIGEEIEFKSQNSYSIFIYSTCPSEDTSSDFRHYYDVLENAGDKTYNLKFVAASDNQGVNVHELSSFKDVIQSSSEIIDKIEDSSAQELFSGFAETMLSDIKVAENYQTIPTFLMASMHSRANWFIDEIKEFGIPTSELEGFLNGVGMIGSLTCGRMHPCLISCYGNKSNRIPT